MLSASPQGHAPGNTGKKCSKKKDCEKKDCEKNTQKGILEQFKKLIISAQKKLFLFQTQYFENRITSNHKHCF